MKKQLFTKLLCVLFLVCSCSSDDSENLIDFTVSFQNTSIGVLENENEIDLNLNFSRAATEASIIEISYAVENAVYGTDFTTIPAVSSGTISIPVAVGDESATIVLNKLTDPIEGTTRSVDFSISSFENNDWYINGTEKLNVSFTPVASTGSIINLLTGGSTQPNQCFIDLSTGVQTAVKRDSWEIAVYNGSENKIFLNASLLVAAAELEGKTDILSITETTELTNVTLNSFGQPVEVKSVSELLVNLPVSYAQFSNLEKEIVFTDSKEGGIDGTAFADVYTTESQNNVYIVSLGNEIPTTEAEAGSINTTGDHRGFMKVQVLTDGSSYTVRYASLNETTAYKEITIDKDSSKLLTAVSLTDEKVVDVEPETSNWDINFSGVFSYNSGGFGVTYSDYALHNTLGNVGLYQVTIYEVDGDGNRTDFDVPSYTNFGLDDVSDLEFIYDDRAVIASDWRSYSLGIAKDDRYYVIKDNDDNLYKLRFTALLSSNGERGYSQFEYSKIND